MKQLPEQLLNDLKQVKGYDEAAFIEAHHNPAVTSVRLHSLKSSNAFVNAEHVPWCSTGRYLNERPLFTVDPLYHAGAYYVQEASSMFLDHLFRTVFPERSNMRVLDLCAAPGGKSTLLASLLEEDSLLICNEVIRTRAPILEENMSRWGYMNAWVASNDAKDFGKLPGYFDAIVVDAPCSGSGLFRKDAKAINEWSEGNVHLCGQRQQRILSDVWPALKENGVLFYATCSYSPEEDEQILDWLTESFDAEAIDIEVPAEWGIVKTHSPNAKAPGYRFFPHKLKGEGFFIAALRKHESVQSIRSPKFKSIHDNKAFQQSQHLLDVTNWLCVKSKDGNYRALCSAHQQDYQTLSEVLYLRKAGLDIGSPAAKEWLPGHEVALSVNRSLNLPILHLDKEQALRYLKKEEIKLSSLTKGWYIVAYEGLGLGWIKVLENRSNNYLPKNWRIRMDISDLDWA
jgi:16S rRNA C967 or C1407 C5-methylase (RsmB/RsmF family)/NOL1/NOP2/fmu family ribosome biogenesis protein